MSPWLPLSCSASSQTPSCTINSQPSSLAMQSIAVMVMPPDIKHLDQFAQRQDLTAALGVCDMPPLEPAPCAKAVTMFKFDRAAALSKLRRISLPAIAIATRISSPSCKIARSCRKRHQSRWLHKAEEPRICVIRECREAIRETRARNFPSFAQKVPYRPPSRRRTAHTKG